jgi:hypothetical protein
VPTSAGMNAPFVGFMYLEFSPAVFYCRESCSWHAPDILVIDPSLKL